MCSPESWPFRDKQFDFLFRLGTLEDLRDPNRVCQGMVRVGKAGYIEMPTRILESMRGVERLGYVGHSHHRWLCEYSENEVTVLFKHAEIHAYPRFYVTLGPWIGRPRKPHSVNRLPWQDGFAARERILVDEDELEAEFMAFRRRTMELKGL